MQGIQGELPLAGLNPSEDTSDIPSPDDWLAAGATAALDFASMDALVHKMQDQYAEYERLKKIASSAYAEYQKTEALALGTLKAAGKTKYYVENLGTIYIIQKTSVRVPKTLEDKKAFFQHLRSKGEDILYALATVNSAQLNSWWRAQFEESASRGDLGFQIPGIDDPTTQETVGFRKG